jgi:hypothetical protein
MMKKTILILLCFGMTFIMHAQQFSILLPDSLSKKNLDGRLFLIFSTNPSAEPRFQVSITPATQQLFGMDVDDWKPGTAKAIMYRRSSTSMKSFTGKMDIRLSCQWTEEKGSNGTGRQATYIRFL